MNETSEKLTKKVLSESFQSFAEDIRVCGGSDDLIGRAAKGFVDAKLREFYRRRSDAAPIRQTICESVDKMMGRASESGAESVFYSALFERNIPFEIQYSIGPYRVDYLIGETIVFEGDGPHHNNQIEYDKKRDMYIERMGYRVIRMRWKTVALNLNMILDEIEKLLGDEIG